MTFWKALQEQDIYEIVRNMCLFFSMLIFIPHFILLKRKSLRKKTNVLYHFTSTSLLEKIFKDGVLKAINYNLVFCTSNKGRFGSGTTAIKGKKDKGIVIFYGSILKKFRYKIRKHPLLSILLGFDLIALAREEYCTIKRGDLVLTKMRRYNNMLIVSEAEIKEVNFSLALKREIKTVLFYMKKIQLFIIHFFSLVFIIDAFCYTDWFRLNFFPILFLFGVIFVLITFLCCIIESLWKHKLNRKPHVSITT